MLHQLLQVLRRIGAKHIAVLLHKTFEVRLFPPDLLVQHVIQVRQHLFEALHVFRRHVSHALCHVAEHIAHRLLLQHLHQLIERLLRLRIKKFVVVQRLDPASEVRR